MECNFSFKHYEECMEMISKSDSEIELVHDVDHLMDNLEIFSEIEEEYGLTSTFFVRLHAKNYNPFSFEGMEIINSIVPKADGTPCKALGLHFEPRFHDAPEHAVRVEANMLSYMFKQKVNKVSIHEPARFGMLSDDQIPNDFILYGHGSEYYKDKKYISDSGGRWREGCMCQHIGKHDKMIILTHPIWWYENSSAENY